MKKGSYPNKLATYFKENYTSHTETTPKHFHLGAKPYLLICSRLPHQNLQEMINKCMPPTWSWAEYLESSSNRGKHMPFVPSDKHIKSSSQEKVALLAAVVSTQCQEEPEDITTQENWRKRKYRWKTTLTITATAKGKQEVEYRWEEQ